MKNEALLLIDIQNDFCPKGALAVPHGDEVVPVANKLIQKFGDGLVIASQDWHPETHKSFVNNNSGKSLYDIIDLHGLKQVLWPAHCVQGSDGAEFHPDLLPIPFVFCKGEDNDVDSYSAFFDNGKRNKTQLDEFLKSKNIDTLSICGLATDYCVKFTVLDALELGYKVFVHEAGCRAVNLSENDGLNALAEMKTAGAVII